MHHQNQNMTVSTLLEDPHTNRQITLQIKRTRTTLPHHLQTLPLTKTRHINHSAQIRNLRNPQQLLKRLPIHRSHDRTQHFLPLNNIPQRLLQSNHIKRTTQPRNQRNVIRSRRTLHTRNGPQPTLRQRRRQPLGPHPRNNTTTNRLSPTSIIKSSSLESLQTPRKSPSRRRLKHIPQPQPNPRTTKPRHNPHRSQRMTTQQKEIILRANTVNPHNIRENTTHPNLKFGAGGDVCDHAAFGFGQGRPVYFAVSFNRELVHARVDPRNHVVRQTTRQIITNLRISDSHRFISPANPPHQPLTTRLTPQINNTLSNTIHARQNRLNLSQLDTETTNLNLIINTPMKSQLPIRTPTDHITSAIHTLTTTTGIRNETRSSQTRPRQIPTRHTTSNIQLPPHPHRHRTQPIIKHIHPHTRHRHTNRPHHLGNPTIRNNLSDRARNNSLSRPVTINNPAIRTRSHITHPRHRRTLTSQHQTTPRHNRRHIHIRNQSRQMRRRHLQIIHPMISQKPRQLLTRDMTIHNMKRPTSHQRQIKHQQTKIKRKRLQKSIRTTTHNTQLTTNITQITRDLTMLNPHPLRPTRRPRRINHIRQIIRRRQNRLSNQSLSQKIIIRNSFNTHPHIKTIIMNTQNRTRINQNILKPITRHSRIHRHIHTTSSQHPKNRHSRRHRPRQRNSHPHLRTNTPSSQTPSNLTSQLMQPTNRNPLTPLNHRHTRHINTRNRPHQLIQRTIRTTITNPTPTPHLRNQTPLNISKHINVEHAGLGVGHDAGE